MIRAVLFDVDGTLFDWETAIKRSLEAVVQHAPPEDREELPARLLRAIADYTFVRRGEAIVDRRHWLLGLDSRPPWLAALPGAPAQAAELAERFREGLEPVAFPDARPALEALHGEYRLAVLTNSPRGEESLVRLGLRDFFDCVVVLGADERKPRPAAFEKGCRAVAAAPDETMNVGDSIANDVEGALAAGVRLVWVDRYGEPHLTPAGAQRIESLLALPSLIAEVGGR